MIGDQRAVEEAFEHFDGRCVPLRVATLGGQASEPRQYGAKQIGQRSLIDVGPQLATLGSFGDQPREEPLMATPLRCQQRQQVRVPLGFLTDCHDEPGDRRVGHLQFVGTP